MIYYIILVLIIFLLYFFLSFLKIKEKTKKIIFLLVAYIALTIMCSFRSVEVGTDTKQFVNAFSIFKDQPFSAIIHKQVYEPGYIALMVIIGKFTPYTRVFFLIIYSYINFSIILFISRLSKNYFLSTMIYILSMQFLVSMCMIRQYLAIATVLFSVPRLLKRKYFCFALSVFVAFFFHYFSILYLSFILIMVLLKYKKHIFIVSIIAFIPIYIFLPNIVMYFLTHSSNYADYIPYLQNEESQNLSYIFRIPPMLIVIVALLIPVIYDMLTTDNVFLRSAKNIYIKKNRVTISGSSLSCNNEAIKSTCAKIAVVKDKVFQIEFLQIEFVMLIALVLLSNRFGLFTRVYYYFTPFLILAPNLTMRKKNDNFEMLYYCFVCIVMGMFCLYTAKGTYGAENYRFDFTLNFNNFVLS